MGDTAPGSGFDVLGTGVSTVAIGGSDVYGAFVAVDAAVSQADGILNAIALAPQGKSLVLAATDQVGHPLFTPGVGSNTVGSILGASVAIAKGVYVSGTPAVVGVAGDFSGLRWGSVEGIQMAISDQATLTYTDSNAQTVTLNLWQRNMFAVKFEIEVAFACMDKNQIKLLTNADATTTTTTTTTGA